MGNLPASRVVPSAPFAVTGVDYAGPILVKQGARRPTLVKAYIAVFVCMTTKAVHLEAVSDMSTDAFLASLKRFIKRRGMIHQLHSNNGTNFKGAHHELHAMFKQFEEQQTVDNIEEFCRNREIEWCFIPPDAPEFGGLWEAAAKTHLKRIIGNTKLTFEELSTVLVEIEAVLNSRPLFSVSNDPVDSLMITPAHYLIGRPLTAIPEPSMDNVKLPRSDADRARSYRAKLKAAKGSTSSANGWDAGEGPSTREFNLIRADTVVNSDHEDSDAGVVMQSARADVDDERGDFEENVSAVADDGEHISSLLTQDKPNFDRADQEFQKRFVENDFGCACDVC
ncbi:uncharacterized protein LOC134207108 [Armigeres subalbatus]|uniref:uncharacterized protein LOC134207108 n=1 Tax=Armigeres subalbatus TaxID=124917 RepID=UPI002ED24DE8